MGKKILYPHHRGLMFAFNKITYGEGKGGGCLAAPGQDHSPDAGPDDAAPERERLGKLAQRETSEGLIGQYIHATGKVGVLVQVECNTDFVARNDDFVAFAKDVALHVAAANPLYVNVEEIPAADIEAEKRVYEGQLGNVPEQAREKALEGKLRKWYEEVVLLEQPHVNGDKHDGKTIEQLRADLSAKTGENVVVRRFMRFAVGE